MVAICLTLAVLSFLPALCDRDAIRSAAFCFNALAWAGIAWAVA